MNREEYLQDRQDRATARKHLRHTYFKLYLLPWEDKTPDVRRRMAAISAKFQSWA